jgi:hypothetical protein
MQNGEEISGTFSCKPNDKNPRDLDISIDLQVNCDHKRPLSVSLKRDRQTDRDRERERSLLVSSTRVFILPACSGHSADVPQFQGALNQVETHMDYRMR